MITLWILGIVSALLLATVGVSATQVAGTSEADDAQQQFDDLQRQRKLREVVHG